MLFLSGPERRESLREMLADRDVPCPSCEYNLRGVETARCPECGERLEKMVVGDWQPRAAQQRVGWLWMVGMILVVLGLILLPLALDRLAR